MKRKIRLPEPLMLVDVEKLSDLQPTDVLVFSAQHEFTIAQGDRLRGLIKDMLAKNGMDNRVIVLSRDVMLNVLRLEP